MIHKDIDPKNIILGKDGKYKYTDFGVSKTYSETISSITLSGKLKFMAPEFEEVYAKYGISGKL